MITVRLSRILLKNLKIILFFCQLSELFGIAVEAEPRIGRIQLIHIAKDAAGKNSFTRLDLSKGAIRDKIRTAQNDDELSHFFQTDGVFE